MLREIVDDPDEAGDCDGVDGAPWLAVTLRSALTRTGMNHRAHDALSVALLFVEALEYACSRAGCECTPRQAAAAVLDAWHLGDRGAFDAWWRWSS